MNAPLGLQKYKIMRLYHFRDEKYGLRSLTDKRSKIARINELNDPFEMLGCNLSDSNQRQAFQTMKNKLNEDNGLLCFSANWRSPVQWAHYTNNHKGVCLEFEVPGTCLIKISYINSRLKCADKIDKKYMLKVLSTKFSHWKYEKEYRYFLGLDHTQKENNLYFEPFSGKLKLKKVIVGCNSELQRSEIKNALGKIENNIEIFKARPAFGSFRIVKNQNEKSWT